MTSWRTVGIRLMVIALAVWPPLHFCLSKAWSFSAWRFAGWGMYATPHPSRENCPIHVLLSFPGHDGPGPIPLAVSFQGKDISQWLERQRGVFLHTWGGPSHVELLAAPRMRALESIVRGVRELGRTNYVEQLATEVRNVLAEGAIGASEIFVIVGDRRVDVLRNRYGTAYDVYSLPHGSDGIELVREAFREVRPATVESDLGWFSSLALAD
jgi:hypothetical protein